MFYQATYNNGGTSPRNVHTPRTKKVFIWFAQQDHTDGTIIYLEYFYQVVSQMPVLIRIERVLDILWYFDFKTAQSRIETISFDTT